MKAMVLLAAAAMAAGSVARAADQPDPKAASAGRALFLVHCASCHGEDGKGGGPVAASLKSALPDLTALPLKDGKFDEARVRTSIDGTHAASAHGSREMPVWGKVLAKTGVRRGEGAAQSEVWTLVEYVRSIQAVK